MLSSYIAIYLLVPILCVLSFFNLVFGICPFDVALIGACISMISWMILILNNFDTSVLYTSLSIIGLFVNFNAFVTLWNYRYIHKRKGYLCL